MMFEIALNKAQLSADRVWFCGDSVYADINGAHGVGMFPVLYEGSMDEENLFASQNGNQKIDFEYLHIHHWKEMIELLKQMR